MIDPYIQLGLGVFLLTLLLSYAVWSRFRIVIIRQGLFAVRDELWAKALELQCFDDPAYRQTRDTLNSMIRSAHRLSLPALAYAMLRFDYAHIEQPPHSERQEVQEAIDSAISQAAGCIISYVINCRPISGWLLMHVAVGTVSIHAGVSRWFQNGGPNQLEPARC